MGKILQTDPRDEMREILSEGLSDKQADEYREYAVRIRQIENSDFVARELAAHLESLASYKIWLAEGVEGADVTAEMIAHHRRCAQLCEREITRRQRANKYGPHAGLRFRDFGAERAAIKERTPDIIGQYIHLQLRGEKFVACCPFHDDRTPSFVLDHRKGTWLWYCFTCGIGGDVFDFIAKIEARK